jgi:hypothetical protein
VVTVVLSACDLDECGDDGESAADDCDDDAVTHLWCLVVVVRILAVLDRWRIRHLSFHALGRRFGLGGG